jgi:hypothetical protein
VFAIVLWDNSIVFALAVKSPHVMKKNKSGAAMQQAGMEMSFFTATQK